MPEACPECAGRGGGCPTCQPPPEKPPEPVKPGCQQCRVKDGQIGSLLGIVKLDADIIAGAYAALPERAPALEEVHPLPSPVSVVPRPERVRAAPAGIQACMERIHEAILAMRVEYVDAKHSVSEQFDAIQAAASEAACHAISLQMSNPLAVPPGTQVVDLRPSEPLSERQRNPDLANTIALIEVAAERCVNDGPARMGDLLDSVNSLRHDFEDGPARYRGGPTVDTSDYGRRTMLVEPASQTEIRREDGGLFLTPEGDPNPRIEHVPSPQAIADRERRAFIALLEGWQVSEHSRESELLRQLKRAVSGGDHLLALERAEAAEGADQVTTADGNS